MILNWDEKKPSWDLFLYCLAWVCAAVLLTAWLTKVPGIHGDEAWVALRARDILGGARPWIGMADFTGPIHGYLIAPWIAIFGYRLGVLRGFTAACFLIGLFLYFRILIRLYDKPFAIRALLVLVTLPMFLSYGRISNETYALNPLLALISMALLVRSPRKPIHEIIAGVILGLGIWNHLMFASLPVALFLLHFFNQKTRIFRSATLYRVAIPFVLVNLPRGIYQVAHLLNKISAPQPSPVPGFTRGTETVSIVGRLWDWPRLFFEVMHGDIYFQRHMGEVLWPTPWVIPILFLAGLFFLTLRFPGLRFRNSNLSVLKFGATLFFTTLLICPKNSDRYFMSLLFLVPISLAHFFWTLAELRLPRAMADVLLLILVAFQFERIRINYFESGLKSGGHISYYRLGNQPETSNHFISTQAVYQKLLDLGAKQVWTEFFIAEPLRFFDLNHHQISRIESVDRGPIILDSPDPNTYGIVYVGGLTRLDEKDFPAFKEVWRNSSFVILQLSRAER